MMEEDEKASSSILPRRKYSYQFYFHFIVQFREYLEANGYDTSQLGLKEVLDPESGSVHSEKDVKKDTGIVGDHEDIVTEKAKIEERNDQVHSPKELY